MHSRGTEVKSVLQPISLSLFLRLYLTLANHIFSTVAVAFDIFSRSAAFQFLKKCSFFSFCQVTGLEKSSCICLSLTLVETLHSLWCTFSLQSCFQQLYGKHQRVFVPLETNEYNEHLQWLHISVGRTLHHYRKDHGFESRRGPVNFQVSIRDNSLNGPDK